MYLSPASGRPAPNGMDLMPELPKRQRQSGYGPTTGALTDALGSGMYEYFWKLFNQ